MAGASVLEFKIQNSKFKIDKPLRPLATSPNLGEEWLDGTGNVFVIREEVGASEGREACRPANCTKQATPAPPALLLGVAAGRWFSVISS